MAVHVKELKKGDIKQFSDFLLYHADFHRMFEIFGAPSQNYEKMLRRFYFLKRIGSIFGRELFKTVICEVDGVIVSSVSVRPTLNRRKAYEIFNVATHKEHLRKGYAKRLMSYILNQLKERTEYAVADTFVNNIPAKNLFTNLGFKEVAVKWITKHTVDRQLVKEIDTKYIIEKLSKDNVEQVADAYNKSLPLEYLKVLGIDASYIKKTLKLHFKVKDQNFVVYIVVDQSAMPMNIILTPLYLTQMDKNALDFFASRFSQREEYIIVTFQQEVASLFKGDEISQLVWMVKKL